MGSAISTPTFKALSGNIFNANGSTPIYSAGAWSFLNSSAVSVFSVSDAGAVTAGQLTPGAVSITHVLRGYYLELDNRQTSAAASYMRFKAGGSQIGAVGATTTNCFELWNAADNAKNAECTNAGSWVWGPSDFAGSHFVRIPSAYSYLTSSGTTANGLQLKQMTGSGGSEGPAIYFRQSENLTHPNAAIQMVTNSGTGGGALYFYTQSGTSDVKPTLKGSVSAEGAWTFPVSVSVTGTADVSGTSAALRTDGGCYVAKIMSAGTVTDRTPFPEDLKTAIDAVNSMEKLPEGEYDSANKEKQLDHSKLHPYLRSGDYRDLSATVSCLVVYCRELSAQVTSLQAKVAALEAK